MRPRREVLNLFREHEDFTKNRVAEGVEKYRKGNLTIKITDNNGNPIKDAKIKVAQKKHDFKFGANLFALDQMETDEKNSIYKETFKSLFNIATLPFYWFATEPEKGHFRYDKNSTKVYRRPPIDLCIEFCEANGIEPREHSLAYQTSFPGWLQGKSSFEIKKELTRRIKEIAERYASKVPTIEVTNEMYWDMDGICFYKEDDYVEWCFKQTEKYMPNNQIAINEHAHVWYVGNGTNRDRYYMQIERLLKKGVRIDAIGTQFHMFNKLEDEYEFTRKTYNPKYIYRVMDKYAEFNLPLQLTEITIPAYTESAEDEEIQAEILKNLYSIWFSHKNTEQIVYWNFIDGYAAGKLGDMTSGENRYHGGIMRFDLSKKPAFYVLDNLINKEWKTNESFVTNDFGIGTFKGFYGEYDVEIEAFGKKVLKQIHHSKNTENNITISI